MHEHKKARTRKTRLQKRKQLIFKKRLLIASLFILTILVTMYVASKIETLSPVGAVSAPTHEVEYIEKQVDVVREVEVDRTFTTEKQQILAYLVEKFGNDSDKAIIMIGTCENSTFAADRKSGLNIQQSGRRSYDIGVMQINVDENDLDEQKKLTNWKYNIDRGYAKYKAAGNKFTAWTCATKIGQKNYLDK